MYLKTQSDTFRDIQTHAGSPKSVSPMIIRNTADQMNISDLKPDNADIIQPKIAQQSGSEGNERSPLADISMGKSLELSADNDAQPR